MTRYTTLTAIAVSAFAFSAAAETCREKAGQWFDLQDAKWEAVGSLSDAYHDYGEATHELHKITHEHWRFYFDYMLAVARAKDEQTKAGSEEPDYHKMGMFLWDRNDALEAAQAAKHDAQTKVSDAHVALLDAQIASLPYLDRYGTESAIVVELIKCVLDRRR